MAEYPELEEADLKQALELAAASLDERVVELRKASQESAIRSYYR